MTPWVHTRLVADDTRGAPQQHPITGASDDKVNQSRALPLEVPREEAERASAHQLRAQPDRLRFTRGPFIDLG